MGRRDSCSLSIDNERISGEHAVVRWSGEHWEVRDLGSTNGTQLDGRALPAGQRVRLERGAMLVFGARDERWRLVDAGPPVAAARHVTSGRVCRAEEGLLALPDADAPEVSIYLDDEGRWRLESGEETRTARDQELVTAADGEWRIELPPAEGRVKTTRLDDAGALLLEDVTLAFEHSLDEETVRLTLRDLSEPVDLKARSSHYMLLLLARQRLADRDKDALAAGERGWLYVDELCRDLGFDQYRLNVQIYRSRQFLAKAGIANAGQLVERRPGTQQLRLGSERLSIAAFRE